MNPTELRLCLVNIDYVMRVGDAGDNRRVAPRTRAPVIRVFGSRLGDYKRCCIHIYGVYPYLLFRPENIYDNSFSNLSSVQGYLPGLRQKLEDLLHIRKSTHSPQSARSSSQYVHSMDVLMRKSIYGYHASDMPFAKVSLFDPDDVRLVVQILEEGSLGVVMQPYEAHLPYLLKFKADYNISPMGFLRIRGPVKYRGGEVSRGYENVISTDGVTERVSASMNQSAHQDGMESRKGRSGKTHQEIADDIMRGLTSADVQLSQPSTVSSHAAPTHLPPGLRSELRQPAAAPAKFSTCELEVDAHIDDILNPLLDVGDEGGAPGFGAELWEEEKRRREQEGLEPEEVYSSPPCTPSVHRAPTECEKEFQRRVDSLILKGKALYDAETAEAAAALAASSVADTGVTGPSAGTLSPPALSVTSATASRPRQSAADPSLQLSPDDLNHSQQPLSQVSNHSGRFSQRRVSDGRSDWALRAMSQELWQRQVSAMDPVDEDAIDAWMLAQNDIFSRADEVTIVADRRLSGPVDPSLLSLPIPAFAGITEPERVQDGIDLLGGGEGNGGATAVGVAEDDDDDNAGEDEVAAILLINSQETYQTSATAGATSDVVTVRKASPAAAALLSNDPATPLFDRHGDDTLLISSVRRMSSVRGPPSSTEFASATGSCVRNGDNSASSGSYAKPHRRLSLLTALKRKRPGAGKRAQYDRKMSAPTAENYSRPAASLSRSLDTESSFSLLECIDEEMNSNDDDIFGGFKRARTDQACSPAKEDIKIWSLGVFILAPSFGCAPSAVELTPIEEFGLRKHINPVPFYSDYKDAEKHGRPISIGGRQVFVTHSKDLPPFIHHHRFVEHRSTSSNIGCGIQISLESEKVKANEPKRTTRALMLVPPFQPPLPRSLWGNSTAAKHNIVGNADAGGIPADYPLVFEPLSNESPQRKSGTEISTPTQSNPKVLNMKVGDKYSLATTKDAFQASTSTSSGAEAYKSRLVTMSIEIFCRNRTVNGLPLIPNPKFDSVDCICWTVDDIISDAQSEDRRRSYGTLCVLQQPSTANSFLNKVSAGVVNTGQDSTGTAAEAGKQRRRMCQERNLIKATGFLGNGTVEVVPDEVALFKSFISHVTSIDPDFLIGYEVQRSSLGYIIERSSAVQLDMLRLLSRVPTEEPSRRNEYDTYAEEHESGIFITGRFVLNAWRRMKAELKLDRYTYTNVAEHLLQRKVPQFTPEQLTRYFSHPATRRRTIAHVHRLSVLNLDLIDKLDLMRRTAESARLYGIDFFSVLTRGSQYRVEAALLRTARRRGYVLLSPSKHKVANQAAMAVIPLVMEPISGFYSCPVVVLDFQALYPSMCIAYNLCYSTIMGKLRPGMDLTMADTTGRLGCSEYPEDLSAAAAFSHLLFHEDNGVGVGHPSPPGPLIEGATEFARDNRYRSPDKEFEPYIAPNGSIFCSKNVRKGLLPQMLKEILETRFMVKRAMKRYAGQASAQPMNSRVDYEVLQRVLDARQLSIKLLANVIYGYTAAGFSGRMPMAELADAIVQCGRSTLEWAVKVVKDTAKWKAEVVYGDTDSIFVHLPGRSREEAVSIGNEIASVVTALSPPDVVLKFEKVFFPCILASKKRYVGAAFETAAQKESHFDAKGIECVRRDQCGVTTKLQEKSLRILFETRDLSLVKQYLCKQWDKILSTADQIPIRDFMFCKEVKLGHYRGIPPPGAQVATQQMVRDPMAEPPYKWRVPYVIVSGAAGSRLIDLAVTPEEVLHRGSCHRINTTYYITKCINPSLDRVLGLCGVDVASWYESMKKRNPRLRLTHALYGDPEQERRQGGRHGGSNGFRQQSMDRFMLRLQCEVCSAESTSSICRNCRAAALAGEDGRGGAVYASLAQRLSDAMREEASLREVCKLCVGASVPSVLFLRGELIGPDACSSLDCEIFFRRFRRVLRVEDLTVAVDEIENRIAENTW